MARTPRSTAPPWAISPSAASSAWAWKNPTAGRTRCKAPPRSASGRSTEWPTGCGPGSPSSAACWTTGAGCRWWKNFTAGSTATSPICGTRRRWRAWRWSIRSKRRSSTAAARARETVENHILGYYQALIEGRIPFEMVHDRIMDAAAIAPYKVLILPNIAALSEAQCGQLREFVRGGGGGGRHLRNLALRRRRSAQEQLWTGRPVWRRVRGRQGRAHDELLSTARDGCRNRQAPPVAGRARGRDTDHQRRLPRAYPRCRLIPESSADPGSLVPRLADGGSFPARSQDRPAGSLREGIRKRASGLFSVGHRSRFLGSAGGGSRGSAAQRGGLGGQRAAAGPRDRERGSGCDRVAAEELA